MGRNIVAELWMKIGRMRQWNRSEWVRRIEWVGRWKNTIWMRIRWVRRWKNTIWVNLGGGRMGVGLSCGITGREDGDTTYHGSGVGLRS